MADFQSMLIMPVAVLAAYGLLVLLFTPTFRRNSVVLGSISILGIAASAYFTFLLWGSWQQNGPMETAWGMVRVDGFGLFFSFIVLAVGLLSVLVSMRFLEREDADHGEFYALILFALAGMVVMVNTTHLMMVLIGLEIFSLSLYVLTGLTRARVRSVEAALKYFLLGAFSSGFMVYGMALLYGVSGSLDLRAISAAAGSDPSTMMWLGMGLVFIGLAFKIAIVPFHHWVPDVYLGAPTNVTGFMAAATKTVAIAVLLRFVPGAFGNHSDVWIPMITVLAILTMTVANLVALAQNNVKRLLAFSSIVHAGYLLIAVVCLPDRGVRSIIFYLTTYAFMTVGAFAVAAAVGRGDAHSEQGYDFRSWAGLGRNRPGLALAMTVFLFSLAGIPPTGGFVGKYVIFQAAIESERYLLAVAGALNAVIAACYYLRLIVVMWMKEPEEVEEFPMPVSGSTAFVVVVAVIAVFWLGILPGWVLDLTRGLAALLV
jgi:NADH-quinone oxidoreductase subunit N